MYALRTLIVSQMRCIVSSLKNNGVPWTDERRCASMLSLLGGSVAAGGVLTGLVLDTGTGTLMIRRFMVLSWMPNLRKASRICRQSTH